MKSLRLLTVAALVGCSTLSNLRAEDPKPDAEGWISLFNGKDLTGWTPKITGHDLGDNFANTFRVEDGVIKVAYDGYTEFAQKFGHLFYKTPYTDYIFQVEYRFTGEQVKGGPGWAKRNSGVMIHGQDPATMTKGQDFPVSLEVQLLGGFGEGERTTGNLCTPGTIVSMDGQIRKEHCISSKSKTFHGEVWVTCEIETRGNKVIHRINGEDVISYENPVLDPKHADAQKLIKDGNVALTGGTISLQSESHPVEFRNIRIKPLK